MPFVPQGKDTAAKKKPHLLLKFEDQSGIPIYEGSALWLVENPDRLDGLFPMFITKIRHNALTFTTRDLDGNLTEYTYRLVSGKPKSAGALNRMRKNRGGQQASQTAPTAPIAITGDQGSK